jgi:hypothetical protein
VSLVILTNEKIPKPRRRRGAVSQRVDTEPVAFAMADDRPAGMIGGVKSQKWDE